MYIYIYTFFFHIDTSRNSKREYRSSKSSRVSLFFVPTFLLEKATRIYIDISVKYRECRRNPTKKKTKKLKC